LGQVPQDLGHYDEGRGDWGENSEEKGVTHLSPGAAQSDKLSEKEEEKKQNDKMGEDQARRHE